MYIYFQMDNVSVNLSRYCFCCLVNVPVTHLRSSWCQSFRYTKHTLGHFKLRGKRTNVVRKT